MLDYEISPTFVNLENKRALEKVCNVHVWIVVDFYDVLITDGTWKVLNYCAATISYIAD